MVLTDRAAWSRPRQIQKQHVKADRMTPASPAEGYVPIQRLTDGVAPRFEGPVRTKQASPPVGEALPFGQGAAPSSVHQGSREEKVSG
jgi:hypothetical protein